MSLSQKIQEIINKTENSAKLDLLNLSSVLCHPSLNYIEISDTISVLLNTMLSNSYKSPICLEIMQCMVSMCSVDVLDVMSSTSIIHELSEFFNKCTQKELVDDFLKFLQNIAKQNHNNPKYKKLVTLYYDLKPQDNPNNTNTSSNVIVSYPQNESFEDDLQRAIKLSLETAPQNLNDVQSSAPVQQMPQKQLSPLFGTVLFDFVAEEPGELSIKMGEIVVILERCNDSWWKGQVNDRVGLFPSNFVRLDSNLAPTQNNIPQVNEETMNKCLNALLDANPVYPGEDEEEIKRLEEQCKKMKPLVSDHIYHLKEKQKKYSKMDQEYNELILSYNQLMDSSRQTIEPIIRIPTHEYNQPPNYYPPSQYQYDQTYPVPSQPQSQQPNSEYDPNYNPNNPYNQWKF